MAAETKRSKLDESQDDSDKWCFCGKKVDKTGFMICCDSCEIWYHGSCAGISLAESKRIDKYFCKLCYGKDPNLITVYKPTKKEKDRSQDKAIQSLPESKLELKEQRNTGCRECIACFRDKDCGECENCLTKKHFCLQRICVQFGEVPLPNTPPLLTTSIRLKLDPDENNNDNIIPETNSPSSSLLKSKKHLTGIKKKSNNSHSNEISFKIFEQRPSRRIGREPKSSVNAKLASVYNNYISSKRFRTEMTKNEQQCFGPKCINSARIHSKYCSDECGLALARNRLGIILPQHVMKYFSEIPFEETKDLEKIKEIEEQINSLREQLGMLSNQQQNLTSFILALRTATPTSNPNAVDEESFWVSCAICSGEFTIKEITRHLQNCFVKTEKQSTYGTNDKLPLNPMDIVCDAYNKIGQTFCKRLRVICSEHYKDEDDRKICGCPLIWYAGRSIDFKNIFIPPEDLINSSDYCREKRKHCLKHQNWAQTALGLIDNEKMNLLNKLDELNDKHGHFQMRYDSRGDIFTLLCNKVERAENQTTEETDPIDLIS